MVDGDIETKLDTKSIFEEYTRKLFEHANITDEIEWNEHDNTSLIDITETTAMNPQFHIQIPRSAGTGGGSQSGNQTNAAGGPSGSSKCHVVVSVTQVNLRFRIKT